MLTQVVAVQQQQQGMHATYRGADEKIKALEAQLAVERTERIELQKERDNLLKQQPRSAKTSSKPIRQ